MKKDICMFRRMLIFIALLFSLNFASLASAADLEVIQRESVGDWVVQAKQSPTGVIYYSIWTKAINDPRWNLIIGASTDSPDAVDSRIIIMTKSWDGELYTSVKDMYLKVDDGDWIVIPSRHVSMPSDGFIGMQIDLTDLVDLMKRGNTLKVTEFGEESIARSFSLRGFTASWNWLLED